MMTNEARTELFPTWPEDVAIRRGEHSHPPKHRLCAPKLTALYVSPISIHQRQETHPADRSIDHPLRSRLLRSRGLHVARPGLYPLPGIAQHMEEASPPPAFQMFAFCCCCHEGRRLSDGTASANATPAQPSPAQPTWHEGLIRHTHSRLLGQSVCGSVPPGCGES